MPAQYKIEQVAELTEKFNGAEAIFVVEYRGLSVAQMSEIRKMVRNVGGEMKVGRNTLARIALTNCGFPAPEDLTVGPNVYAIAKTESPAVAKALKEFGARKENKAMVIKGGIMGQEILDANKVMALADIPSREILLTMLVGTLMAPVRGFATVISKLADKKKEESAA